MRFTQNDLFRRRISLIQQKQSLNLLSWATVSDFHFCFCHQIQICIVNLHACCCLGVRVCKVCPMKLLPSLQSNCTALEAVAVALSADYKWLYKSDMFVYACQSSSERADPIRILRLTQLQVGSNFRNENWKLAMAKIDLWCVTNKIRKPKTEATKKTTLHIPFNLYYYYCTSHFFLCLFVCVRTIDRFQDESWS